MPRALGYLQEKRECSGDGRCRSLCFEVGHPLLASLGRVGQDFSLALDDAGGEAVATRSTKAMYRRRHPICSTALQTKVRVLQPDYVRDMAQTFVARHEVLRVHAACRHWSRRPEVLKDPLLGFSPTMRRLQPRDIVVMAPDIAAYAPFPVGVRFPVHRRATATIRRRSRGTSPISPSPARTHCSPGSRNCSTSAKAVFVSAT